MPAEKSPAHKKNMEVRSFKVLERDSRVEKNHAPQVPSVKEVITKIIKLGVFSFINKQIELLLR